MELKYVEFFCWENFFIGFFCAPFFFSFCFAYLDAGTVCSTCNSLTVIYRSIRYYVCRRWIKIHNTKTTQYTQTHSYMYTSRELIFFVISFIRCIVQHTYSAGGIDCMSCQSKETYELFASQHTFAPIGKIYGLFSVIFQNSMQSIEMVLYVYGARDAKVGNRTPKKIACKTTEKYRCVPTRQRLTFHTHSATFGVELLLFFSKRIFFCRLMFIFIIDCQRHVKFMTV